MSWSEPEYARHLATERRHFAWVLCRYGGLSDARAQAAALERYPYEPGDDPHRGLIFHDEAWHWAMLSIHGDAYVVDHPELVQPSAEYRALD